MSSSMFDSTNALQTGLNACTLRNQVISNNIANADTPNFKASNVEFEEYVNAAMDDEDLVEKIGSGEISAQVVTDTDTTMRADGNNVDIENEMSRLAENNIQYYALLEKLNSEFSQLRTAIMEGG